MTDTPPTHLRLQYRNWRGETSIRHITPIEGSLRWGATEHHTEPCWLINVFDHDQNALRTYSLANCDFTRVQQPFTGVDVVRRTAEVGGVSTEELCGPSRDQDLVELRWAAMLLIRRHLGWSYPRIARALGRSDHVTAMHGVRRAGLMADTRPEYARVLERIEELI